MEVPSTCVVTSSLQNIDYFNLCNFIALSDIHSSGMMLLLFAIIDDNGQLL